MSQFPRYRDLKREVSFLDFANALLSETISSGNAPHVRALLAAGADPNQTSQGGQTPLILAIVSGNLHLVNMLLEAGADPSQRDQTGLNAIEWAERKGLPDVAKVLQNPRPAVAKVTIESPPRTSRSSATRIPGETKRNQAIAADEKSRRWISGLKQRLDEKADRDRLANQATVVQPEIETTNQPVVSRTPPPPLVDPPAIDAEPITSAPASQTVAAGSTSRAVAPQASQSNLLPPEPSTTGSTRKRCPQCNTVYNSSLVAYCAYHVVPLVDVDAPVIKPPPPKGMTPLLWFLVFVTFVVASLMAYIGIAPLYRQKKQTPAATPSPTPTTVPGKGVPVVSGDLSGKAVAIPDVYAPTKLTEPVSVVVRIKVDRKGQVISAQAVGGDDTLREATLKSARKAEFSANDLGPRGAQATITYVFNP